MIRRLAALVINPKMVIAGAILAMFLILVCPTVYHSMIEQPLFDLPHWLSDKHVNIHFLTNEVVMCLFFAVVAKEVRESLLPGGSLHGMRTASLPLLATVGGVLGPMAIFVGLTSLIMPEIRGGLVVPTATDIVFAALLAGVIFKGDHPAKQYLLTIAVVDDGIGLVLIPAFYSKGVNWLGFALLVVTQVLLTAGFRKIGVRRWGWYLILLGIPSWMGFVYLGVEPAMALVPIVAMMPHAHTDLGILDERELTRKDALSRMEHAFNPFMGLTLFLFGFANCGVVPTNVGTVTFIVLASLVIGKFLGIVGFTRIGLRCGLTLPDGMKWHDVPVVGLIAGIGFTVAIFVISVAFTGDVADQAKVGATLSLFVCALLVWAWTKLRRTV